MNNLGKLFRFVNEDGAEIIFNSENGYLINKPQGIDMLTVEFSETQGISQVGTTITARQIKSRPITIEGITMSKEYKDKLILVFRPDIKGVLYADDWQIECYVQQTPSISAEKEQARFQIQLIAPYAYWKSTRRDTYFLLNLELRFRFPWNISRPYAFGKKINSVYGNVENKGYIKCGYIADIKALSDEATWFMLEDMDTGEYIKIEKPFNVGEQIRLTCENGMFNVMSSTDGDITGTVAIGSNLFQLNVGKNYIKPSSDIDANNFNCSISVYTETAGVTA